MTTTPTAHLVHYLRSHARKGATALRAALSGPEGRFALASLSPAVFLALGAALGGVWALLGLLWITLFLFLADRLARRLVPAPDAAAVKSPAADSRLPHLIAVLHFFLLFFALFALSGGTGLGLWAWLACFLGLGLWFGQVAFAAAHELIHRPGRWSNALGVAVYASLLYGHHASAHRLIHHRFVATEEDPNSARLGESFWSFLQRAWPGEFLAGYEMENSLRQRQADKAHSLHPYSVYLAGSAAMLVLVLLGFGFDAFLVFMLLAAHSHIQLLLCDYVQHYGLERQKTGIDSYEPFGPEHSWDAPDLFSGMMLLHAPRHADHHAHPAKPFGTLALSPDGAAPLLPASLPVMATIALVPPLWRKVMDRRVMAIRRSNVSLARW
ncbi:MAG: alkane 1-monooxygenase [Paracoccaceae bacterium]